MRMERAIESRPPTGMAVAGALMLALALPQLPGPARAQGAGNGGDAPPHFSLPVDCVLGESCFVQQLPDMDGGSGRADPFCGTASYDGHKGTDFRVRSMQDVESGVAVVAPAPGTVARVRDGEPDRLVATQEEAASIEGRECGNGVMVEHAGGLRTLMCHLREGSIAVSEGERVARGQKLGEVGASGLSSFPHVQMEVIGPEGSLDPFSGRPVGGGCLAPDDREAAVDPLWHPVDALALGRPGTQLLDAGLAAGAVGPDDLVRAAPDAPDGSGPAVVYGWGINLRDGDVMRLRLEGPNGEVSAEESPVEGDKAQWVAFAGRRNPGPGPYSGRVEIVRDGEVIAARDVP